MLMAGLKSAPEITPVMMAIAIMQFPIYGAFGWPDRGALQRLSMLHAAGAASAIMLRGTNF
jgi:hypothetical protein